MSDTISPNTTIGQYTIVSKIGEGGMGEVYRARDGRLDRNVAIKILPANFATDADRLNRFEQEARATSALNHPNILTVYDIGTHDGSPYFVAELLEGEELRDRLDRGSIPLRKVIEYAQQIVSGLEAAHGKGIVHRDLKPENLFITEDERVKILDFGIAKLSESGGTATGSEDATRKALTNPGVVMGTVGYMSPEQVRGAKSDQRSDIFSFGAILHEMITGRRAFRRDTIAETMTAILKEEPVDFSATIPSINPALERIVQRCLEKKPERRFHTAHDLGFALESLSTPTTSSGSTVSTIATAESGTESSVWRARIPWIALAAATLIAIGALAIAYSAFNAFRSRSSAELQTVRLNIIHGQRTTAFGQFAVSPDGRSVVISTLNAGRGQLWLRSLDALSARPLPNTQGAQGFPFWSPDSRAIAFGVAGKLKKIDLADGRVTTICDMPTGDRRGFGGTWNREGAILVFVAGSILRVPATGGEPTGIPDVNIVAASGAMARWPTFLPDGNHFLYLVTTPQQASSEVFVASLDGKDIRRLLTANSNAMYASSPTGEGYLMFARGEALLAQAFDPKTLTISGEPKRVADQIGVNSNSRGFFSFSDNGILVYDQFTESESRQLTWFDREAKEVETLGETANINLVRLSPDQKRAAVAKRDPGMGFLDLWVVDARGAASRITSGPSDTSDFVWSPDNNYLAWGSSRDQRHTIVRKLASGAGQEEVLLEADRPVLPTDWSPDGKFILYNRNDPMTRNDIWVLPLEGDRKPFAFFQSPAADSSAVFSPDGRWVAYQSGESSIPEIYVQTFPASGDKKLVSTKGGLRPRWRGDGKELFYITPEGKMMAVEIKAGATFEPGVPNLLFDVATARTLPTTPYDVATDGRRFLFISGQLDAGQASLAVVLNWISDLKK
ncbi:MAG TPA: protein kinase [Pyrinomonadaceae bacterium]|nr:protein kinase [Pyrinomonadaceae bacterium]